MLQGACARLESGVAPASGARRGLGGSKAVVGVPVRNRCASYNTTWQLVLRQRAVREPWRVMVVAGVVVVASNDTVSFGAYSLLCVCQRDWGEPLSHDALAVRLSRTTTIEQAAIPFAAVVLGGDLVNEYAERIANYRARWVSQSSPLH